MIQTWIVTAQAGILAVATVLALSSETTGLKGWLAALTSVVTLKYASTSWTKISPRIKLNFCLSVAKLPTHNPGEKIVLRLFAKGGCMQVSVFRSMYYTAKLKHNIIFKTSVKAITINLKLTYALGTISY